MWELLKKHKMHVRWDNAIGIRVALVNTYFAQIYEYGTLNLNEKAKYAQLRKVILCLGRTVSGTSFIHHRLYYQDLRMNV
jgi:hypothetical protein